MTTYQIMKHTGINIPVQFSTEGHDDACVLKVQMPERFVVASDVVGQAIPASNTALTVGWGFVLGASLQTVGNDIKDVVFEPQGWAIVQCPAQGTPTILTEPATKIPEDLKNATWGSPVLNAAGTRVGGSTLIPLQPPELWNGTKDTEVFDIWAGRVVGRAVKYLKNQDRWQSATAADILMYANLLDCLPQHAVHLVPPTSVIPSNVRAAKDRETVAYNWIRWLYRKRYVCMRGVC
jgi:hypothetical protein